MAATSHDDQPGCLPRPQADPVEPDEHQHGTRGVAGEVDRPVAGAVERDAGDVVAQHGPDVVDSARALQVLRAVVEDPAQPARSVDEGERDHPHHRRHPRQRQQPPPGHPVERAVQPAPCGQGHQDGKHHETAPPRSPRPVTEQRRGRAGLDVDPGQRRHHHRERDEHRSHREAAPGAHRGPDAILARGCLRNLHRARHGPKDAPWPSGIRARGRPRGQPSHHRKEATGSGGCLEPRVATWTSTATS